MATTEFRSRETAIPGLLIFDVTKVEDERGYFQEKFQQAKLIAAGLPESFQVVQTNVALSHAAGVTRGLHAEPWDKYLSVVTGRVFSAFVDLRDGPTFGTLVTAEITPAVAVFLPRGVANSYQTLEADTHYLYHTNAHYDEAKRDQYCSVYVGDKTLAIPWPIPLGQVIITDRDRTYPKLADIQPLRYDKD